MTKSPPHIRERTLAMMSNSIIRHHDNAIEAARIVLEETERSEVRDLANAIIETQQAEIEQLREWREEWY